MERLGLLEELTRMKVVWRFVLVMNGVQCATTCGVLMNLKWYADS